MKERIYLTTRLVYQSRKILAISAKQAERIADEMGEVDCDQRATNWRAKKRDY